MYLRALQRKACLLPEVSFSLSDSHRPDVIFALYGRHFSSQSCQGRQLPTDRERGTRALLRCWGRGARAVVGQDVLPCRGKNYSCTNVIQIHVRTKLEQRQATLKAGIVHVLFVEPLWPTICMRFCPGTRIVVDSNLLQ